MSEVRLEDFEAFFLSLHGVTPFPWQIALAARACAGEWPKVIDLPTGTGKTASLDICIFAMAVRADAPRRIFFVVDRRVVVQEAFERARRVAERLASASEGILRSVADRLREKAGGDTPLEALELRGGIYRDTSWVRSPRQPLIVASTVDQVGSRILFRGYGVAPASWPIHAALVATDSLIFLDEAHCSGAFAETLGRIQRYSGWAAEFVARSMEFIEMTATPSRAAGEPFRLTTEDLAHPVLGRRLRSAKRAALVVVDAKASDGSAMISALAKKALELGAEAGIRRIAVMVNRIATARGVAEELGRRGGESGVHLLIGRMRPVDRDDVMGALEGMRAGDPRQEDEPQRYVVATQCLEVGADFDFDALVTECASLDALQQRFGRLDRLGSLEGGARAAILVASGRLGSTDPDPIYGEALTRTWEQLVLWAEDGTVDMGLVGGQDGPPTIRERAGHLGAEDAAKLRRMGPKAPVLLPGHLDAWVQTSPQPQYEPHLPFFLHGTEEATADVQVVWRADCPEDRGDETAWREIVAVCPPTAAEAMPVRWRDFRNWMSGKVGSGNGDADLENAVDGSTMSTEPAQLGESRAVLVWRGEESRVVRRASGVKPGDTVVVACDEDGGEMMGHIPESGRWGGVPRDWGDRAGWLVRRRALLRLNEPMRGQIGWAEPLPGADETETENGLEEWKERLRVNLGQGVAPVGEWLHGLTSGRLLAAELYREQPTGWLLRFEMRRRRGEEEAGGDELSREGRISLHEHTRNVGEAVDGLAENLAPGYRAVLAESAKWHDVGKGDVRFQTMLRGGDRMAAEMSPVLLAKGEGSPRRSGGRNSGLPIGWRHEYLSFLTARGQELESGDPELVWHLVASHHGRCRPWAEVVSAEAAADAATGSAYRLEAGVGRRFWRYTRRFGWWGLAYLESILRLGDWQASEREQGK